MLVCLSDLISLAFMFVVIIIIFDNSSEGANTMDIGRAFLKNSYPRHR